MKYLTLLILALFLFHASYTQESEILTTNQNVNWTDVNIDDFLADEFSVQAKDFGVQWIISQMIGDDIISNNTSWNLTEIESIQAQRVNGINYKISGTYTNDDDDEFTGEFIVNALAIGPSFQILEASYQIIEGETVFETLEDGTETALGPAVYAGILIPVPIWSVEQLAEENNYEGAWNFVDPSEASSGGQLEPAVNDGVLTAIAQASLNGVLPKGTVWALQSVDYIQEQVTEGTKYAFWVTLTDGDIQRANAAIYYVEGADGNDSVLSTGIWKIGAVAA